MAYRMTFGLGLVSIGALALASCADDHNRLRIAHVGSAAAADYADSGSGSGSGSGSSGSGSGGASATTASNGGGGSTGGSGGGSTGGAGGTGGSGGASNNLVVASGNVLIGAASQYASLTSGLNGTVPATGLVNGKVAAILNTSGHTLVQLGGGTSVLLPGTGGRLGDLVRLDLGRGTVVGGPRPLIGLNVLAANPTTGQLATVSAVSGGNLLGVTVVNPSTNSGSLVLAPQVASLVGLQPTNPSVTSAVTTTVNGTVGGLVNGTLNGTVNGTLGGSLLKH